MKAYIVYVIGGDYDTSYEGIVGVFGSAQTANDFANQIELIRRLINTYADEEVDIKALCEACFIEYSPWFEELDSSDNHGVCVHEEEITINGF
jgi:hypothetical protein